MSRAHVVAYLDRATVDGRIFREVILDESRFPLPVRSVDGTLLGQVVGASVIKTAAVGVQGPLSGGRVEVSCSWEGHDEPDWSHWCLLAELTNWDCEVIEQQIQSGALYRIDISGTLAGVTLSTPTKWPWKADTGV